MPSVYVETTVISYLAARPSSDVLLAGHQKATSLWWENAKQAYDLYISEAVWSEILSGDPDAAAKRIELMSDVPILMHSDDVDELIREYDHRLGLEGRAKADLPHFAYAVSYEMDYLVTWNLKHIASGKTISRLQEANEVLGRRSPIILTPESLME